MTFERIRIGHRLDSRLRRKIFLPIGESWEDKVERTREKLREMDIDAIVVTALDEVAWLFNLRGRDIPYTPVFRGYAVLDMKKVILYIPPEKQTLTVKNHLRSQASPEKF